LGMGTTKECFQSSGNLPVSMDKFRILVNEGTMPKLRRPVQALYPLEVSHPVQGELPQKPVAIQFNLYVVRFDVHCGGCGCPCGLYRKTGLVVSLHAS